MGAGPTPGVGVAIDPGECQSTSEVLCSFSLSTTGQLICQPNSALQDPLAKLVYDILEKRESIYSSSVLHGTRQAEWIFLPSRQIDSDLYACAPIHTEGLSKGNMLQMRGDKSDNVSNAGGLSNGSVRKPNIQVARANIVSIFCNEDGAVGV